MQIPFTHKGWFGLCPVYIANLHSEGPDVAPRFPCTGWLITLSAWIFNTLGSE